MTVQTLPPPEPAAIIVIPPAGPFCDVIDCDGPAKFDLVWYDAPRAQLHLQEVCARCSFVMKGHLPALWFPLDQSPPLGHIAQEVRRHQMRRPGVYVTQNMPSYGGIRYGFGGGNGSNTMAGGFFTW